MMYKFRYLYVAYFFFSIINSIKGKGIRVFRKTYHRDTNLVWDSDTQSGTGHKSGTSNLYPLSNITKR